MDAARQATALKGTAAPPAEGAGVSAARAGPPGAPLRWERAALAALTLACGLLYLCALGRGLAGTTDDGYYVMLARTFWTGHPYREFWEVGRPWHRYYPPGYPLLLAPFVHFFPHDPRLWKLPGALAAAAIVPLTHALARPRLRPATALCAAAWVGLAPWIVLAACGYVISEVPYTTASLAALVLLDRADLDRVASVLPAAGLVFVATVLRTTGLTLAVGGAVWLLLRCRGARSFISKIGPVTLLFLAAVAFLLPWKAYVSRTAIGGGGAYPTGIAGRRTVAAYGHHALEFAWEYATVEIPYTLWLPPTDALGAVLRVPHGGPAPSALLTLPVPFLALAIITAAVLAAGFARDVRRRFRADHAYGAACLALLCLWPYLCVRYVGPLLPLLVLYGASGLEGLLDRLAPLAPHVRLHATVAGLLLATQAVGAVRAAAYTRSPGWPDASQARFYALGRWMDGHLPPGAPIASDLPANLAVVARQPMTALWEIPDLHQALYHLAREGVRYVFLHPVPGGMVADYRHQLLAAYPDRFVAVKGFPIGPERLLRFTPQPGDLRRPAARGPSVETP